MSRTKYVKLRVTQNEHARWREAAHQRRTSISGLIREAVDHLERTTGPTAPKTEDRGDGARGRRFEGPKVSSPDPLGQLLERYPQG